MEIFSLISAIVAIAGLVMTASKNESDANYQQQSQDLAEKQVETQTDIADKNFQLSQEQFEYQKQLNQLQMQREDTEMQRKVADLKKAGLSPLMASGGASTGQLISAPAVQYNGTGIMQAMSNLLGVRNDYASRKQLAYQFERQQHLQVAQQAADLYSIHLDNEYKKRQVQAIDIANAYNLEHGLRDPSLQNYLIDVFEQWQKNHDTSVPKMADDMINKAKNYAKDEAKEIPKKVMELYTKPVKEVITHDTDAIKSALNTAKDAVKSSYNKAKNNVSKEYNYIKNKIRRKK